MEGTPPKLQATPDGQTPDHQGTPQSSSSPCTPPNTWSEPGMAAFMQPDLPSFNSSEMVQRIYEKKAHLEKIGDSDTDVDVFSFTPHNSVADSNFDHLAREHDLPSFYNPDMISTISSKRAELGYEASHSEDFLFSSSSPNPIFAPPNSLVGSVQQPREGWEQELVDEVQKVQDRRLSEKEELRLMFTSMAAGDMPSASTDITSASHMTQSGYTNVTDINVTQAVPSESSSSSAMATNGDSHVASTSGQAEPTESCGNVVALAIAQQMKTSQFHKRGRNIWNSGKMITYTGNDEMEVAFKVAQDTIQKAVEIYEKEILETQSESEGTTEVTRRSSRPYWAERVNGDCDIIIEEFPLENDYLSEVDPLGGNLDLESTQQDTVIAIAAAAAAAAEEDEDERESFNQHHQEESQLPQEAAPPSDEEEEMMLPSIVTMNIVPPSDSSGGDESDDADFIPKPFTIPQDIVVLQEDIDVGADFTEDTGATISAMEETVDFHPVLDSGMVGSAPIPIPENAHVLHKQVDSDDLSGSAKSNTDSDLSESVQDFLARLRSRSEISTQSEMSGDDPLESIQRMEVARYLVDEAISAAVDVYKQVDRYLKYFTF